MNSLAHPLQETMSDNICSNFWQQVLSSLEKELPAQQFKTWVLPLLCLGFDEVNNKVLIAAPNRFKLDFAKKQFANTIYNVARKFWQNCDLIFSLYNPNIHTNTTSNNYKQQESLEQDTNNLSNDAIDKIQARLKANKTRKSKIEEKDNLIVAEDTDLKSSPTNLKVHTNNNFELGDKKQENNIISQHKSKINNNFSYDNSKLNKILSFATFVEGQANMLAKSAAMQIATQPNRVYNPCYFYGNVGLGKTHLMHAIGNHFFNNNKIKIKYIHAEQFVSDVVKAYQRKNYDELKRSYHDLDLLLIDDIQFLSGKTKTQEEFFYVFESLLSKQAQIVITSDTYPRELKDMDERLISRFNSGLLVAIEPPELQMRIKILQSKAKLDNFKLNDEVAFFVAKNLVSNIRELEGALRKLMAYNLFHKVNIDIDIAKIALKDILPDIENTTQPSLTIEYIQKIIAAFYNINIIDMASRKRTANVNKPRQVAMFFAKELTQKSLPEIGTLFGGRDHSTILHAVRKITKDQKTMPELANELNTIRKSFNF